MLDLSQYGSDEDNLGGLGGDTLTWVEISGDTTSFTLDLNGDLRFNQYSDYEVDNNFSIEVRVSDGRGGSFDANFTIEVNPVDEAPEFFEHDFEHPIYYLDYTLAEDTNLTGDLSNHARDPETGTAGLFFKRTSLITTARMMQMEALLLILSREPSCLHPTQLLRTDRCRLSRFRRIDDWNSPRRLYGYGGSRPIGRSRIQQFKPNQRSYHLRSYRRQLDLYNRPKCLRSSRYPFVHHFHIWSLQAMTMHPSSRSSPIPDPSSAFLSGRLPISKARTMPTSTTATTSTSR